MCLLHKAEIHLSKQCCEPLTSTRLKYSIHTRPGRQTVIFLWPLPKIIFLKWPVIVAEDPRDMEQSGHYQGFVEPSKEQ